MTEAWANLRTVADAVTPCQVRRPGLPRCGYCRGCRGHAELVAAIYKAEDAAAEYASELAWGERKEMDGR